MISAKRFSYFLNAFIRNTTSIRPDRPPVTGRGDGLPAVGGRPPEGNQNTYTPSTNTLVIFGRNGQGDVAPRGVIAGDRTVLHSNNQIQIYGPKGWIIATQSTTDTESEPEGTGGF